MDISSYENVLFHKGKFYINKKEIKISCLHNRLKSEEYMFSPLDIDSIESPKIQIMFDRIVLLLHHFHWNAAHMIWDHIYPSWYGLLHSHFKKCNEDFQWITIANLDDKHVYTHKDTLEKFSGSHLDSLESFSKKYEEPLIIPLLITGLSDIGISNIYKNNLLVKRGPDVNNMDPIEIFVNRWYSRYGIKRNSLLDKSRDNCNNVIYIKNKRKYAGVEELFEKMSKKYLNKYHFRIIDYEDFDFEQQLNILNTTCLCVVGIGSARFNTPFLPNGAIEIQTFSHDKSRINYIEYFDYHGGTLSKNVKIKNIPYYTEEEVDCGMCSQFLGKYIDDELLNIPCKIPVNLEENIPSEIKNLTKNKNYDEIFDLWRGNNTTSAEDFLDLLRL